MRSHTLRGQVRLPLGAILVRMDLRKIRRLVIVAMFSDDYLMEHFALKGGNALDLIYGIGSRTSLDIDLSMDNDFEDAEESKQRIFRALRERFLSSGYSVFDERFEMRPSSRGTGKDDKWGGYQVEFKLLEKAKSETLRSGLSKAQREAVVIGPRQERVFRIQISKFEYCVGKKETELDDYVIYVYTLPMIAIEKFRAICQQLPDYPHRSHPTARARDFYDIYSIVTDAKVDLACSENLELFRYIFAAKNAPLSLIPKISGHRDFHRLDWPSVQDSVSKTLRDFDYYFDFVVEQIPRLESLWVE